MVLCGCVNVQIQPDGVVVLVVVPNLGVILSF